MIKKWIQENITHKHKALEVKGEDVVAKARNWYSDRLEVVIIQRNVLLLLSILMALSMFFATGYISKVAKTNTIKPFVVSIDDSNGELKVVNPLSDDMVSNSEALQTYFVVKFLRARESYDSMDYTHNQAIVRLLSNSGTYLSYIRSINSDNGLLKRLGQASTMSVRIRSVTFLERGRVAQVRFRQIIEGAIRSQSDKIATIEFAFRPMELRDEERFENPLGFVVNKYRVDDEVSK